jgi:hypothetical protein
MKQKILHTVKTDTTELSSLQKMKTLLAASKNPYEDSFSSRNRKEPYNRKERSQKVFIRRKKYKIDNIDFNSAF